MNLRIFFLLSLCAYSYAAEKATSLSDAATSPSSSAALQQSQSVPSLPDPEQNPPVPLVIKKVDDIYAIKKDIKFLLQSFGDMMKKVDGLSLRVSDVAARVSILEQANRSGHHSSLHDHSHSSHHHEPERSAGDPVWYASPYDGRLQCHDPRGQTSEYYRKHPGQL